MNRRTFLRCAAAAAAGSVASAVGVQPAAAAEISTPTPRLTFASTGAGAVDVWKYGRAIQASYEQLRKGLPVVMPADLVWSIEAEASRRELLTQNILSEGRPAQ